MGFLPFELKQGQTSLKLQGDDVPSASGLAPSQALLPGWVCSSTEVQRLASILSSLQKKRDSTLKASADAAASTSKALQYPQTRTTAIPTGKCNNLKVRALQESSQLWCNQNSEQQQGGKQHLLILHYWKIYWKQRYILTHLHQPPRCWCSKPYNVL